MVPSKPYLIRAIHEWIVDSDLTPYIVVNTQLAGVQVPEQYIENKQILLNVSPEACRGLHLGNDRIVFSASFAGVAMQIHVPPAAVTAIYARENGRGMKFDYDEEEESGEGSIQATTKKKTLRKDGKPKLTVVK